MTLQLGLVCELQTISQSCEQPVLRVISDSSSSTVQSRAPTDSQMESACDQPEIRLSTPPEPAAPLCEDDVPAKVCPTMEAPPSCPPLVPPQH